MEDACNYHQHYRDLAIRIWRSIYCADVMFQSGCSSPHHISLPHVNGGVEMLNCVRTFKQFLLEMYELNVAQYKEP